MPVGGEVVGPGVSSPSTGGGGSGTVTSVSVVTANGYSGTVANPTTTPAITISGGPPNVASAFAYSSVTADPNPAVIGTYYHCHYAGSGNFTLPTPSTAGDWVWVKQVSANTLTIVGTVDANASFTLTQYQSNLFIWNGTNWDIN